MTNNEAVATTVIPVPDDWHVHLRDDEMLAAVVGYSAARFRYAMVMPNLVPPIISVDQALAYRERIAAAADTASFEPLMTLYLTADLTADEVRRGWDTNAISAVKFYPAGATTNSDSGGRSLADFTPVLETMATLGMPLLVHAESTDPHIDIFDREAAFIADEVAPLLDRIPELSVTVEHLSTSAGVDIVRENANAWGTITPHHLSCDRSDLLANGMRPELYCKPVINSPANRRALVEAACSGDPKFFLGTDSAPHPLARKEARVAAAGIFNAPYALEVTAEVFHANDALEQLGAFVADNGAARYGYPVSDTRLRITRSADLEPAGDETLVTAAGDEVRLFGVAEAAAWTIEPVRS